jgi:hypothetical protein
MDFLNATELSDEQAGLIAAGTETLVGVLGSLRAQAQ